MVVPNCYIVPSYFFETGKVTEGIEVVIQNANFHKAFFLLTSYLIPTVPIFIYHWNGWPLN